VRGLAVTTFTGLSVLEEGAIGTGANVGCRTSFIGASVFDAGLTVGIFGVTNGFTVATGFAVGLVVAGLFVSVIGFSVTGGLKGTGFDVLTLAVTSGAVTGFTVTTVIGFSLPAAENGVIGGFGNGAVGSVPDFTGASVFAIKPTFIIRARESRPRPLLTRMRSTSAL
jgi:hypothetical protein